MKFEDKLVVVRGERVIVLEKPKSYHAAIRGLGRDVFPRGYLGKERASWGSPTACPPFANPRSIRPK